MKTRPPTWQAMSVAALLLGLSVAVAKNLPRYGSFVYSNLCYSKESGDVAGNRVTLIRLGDGDKLIYEYSEGPLMAPLFATDIRIDPKSSRLTFTMQTELEEPVAMQAIITEEALLLIPSDDALGQQEPKRLLRVKNYGEKIPVCK